MYACIDVHYSLNSAKAACLVFAQWDSAQPCNQYVATITTIGDYVPGQFYKRELPCVLAVVEMVQEPLDALVIDGYVWLDASQTPGLGAYVYEALHKDIAVIGVAKNQYHKAIQAKEVFRGISRKPLYVTAAGMEPEHAAQCIQQMHGEHRLPTLLKLVDTCCRETSENSGIQ